MKNKIIPLNVAEAIFYPAFDKHLCQDDQICAEGGEKERLWDSITFRGKNHMVIRWNGQVELKDYDSLICFAAFSVGASINMWAVVDGKHQQLCEAAMGADAPLELKGALKVEDGEKGMLTEVSLDIHSQTQNHVVVLSWLGLSKSDREAELEASVPVWQKSWNEELNEGVHGRIENHIILSEEEGEELKTLIKEDDKLKELIHGNAEDAMRISVEEELREYAPTSPHLYRFTRVRDRGRISLENRILNLAVAGYLLEEASYSYHAARLILALIPMKWYEGPVCEMPGSNFHHVCFQEDHLTTEVCIATGFLGGVLKESAIKRISKKVETNWRFVRSKCMEPGYRNFMNQGVVGNRGAMLGAAFLHLQKGGYETYLKESYERHCSVIENYLTPDGHCPEGGNYFEYSFRTSILLWHVYSRACHKPVTEIVPECFKKSGRYLAAIMSENDRNGKKIPLNCGADMLASTLLMVFMTMVCEFPEGNNYLISRFTNGSTEEITSSFDLLFYLYYKKQIELHPYHRAVEEEISCPEEGLLTYRNGSAKLMVTAERNPLTGHFHEDRGGIVLEAEGEILLPELGTTNYSNPLCLLMDKKEYHNLACPADLNMLVESKIGMEAAAEAAFPIEKELSLEELKVPEANIIYREMREGSYHFGVETGKLFGEDIWGSREGVMDKCSLTLTDQWTFQEDHPLMITYLSYHPWNVEQSQGRACSGSLSLVVDTEDTWEFKTEEGMSDYAGVPVYVLRICTEPRIKHKIQSLLSWSKKEFLPENTGKDNRMALQSLLNEGGTIRIEKPGVYEVEDTLIVKSHTHLIFGTGVFLKRSASSIGSFAIINEGAFTGEYDTDITIEGLNLTVNGVEARHYAAVYGLTGELSFFRVRHLKITDFVCLDLPRLSFGIHVCTFEDLVIERVRIEGRKDAIHLGKGRRFVIRHALMKTFDDPIALNAHDYAVANPQMGWIEDGLIEDCYDLNDEDTTGYFCRILAGAWCDWYKGMEIQNSDTVVSCGRVYRAFQKPDGTRYRSMTTPSHKEGMVTLEGIHWVMVQEDVTYQCGCRNIHFKDIHLQKTRQMALSIHFDHDKYSRSVYPGAVMPVQENLVFENIVMEDNVDCLVRTITPVNTVKVISSVVGKGLARLETLPGFENQYSRTQILVMGSTFTAESSMELVNCEEGRACKLTTLGNIVLHDGFKPQIRGQVETGGSML